VPALAPRLPLPVPVPVPQRLGAPSERYPRPWIVTTWVRGEPADRAPVTRGAAAADALAAFLSALHQPAPAGAPVGRDTRGGPLADSAEGFARFLAQAVERGLIVDPDPVRAVWEDALAAPAWDRFHAAYRPAAHGVAGPARAEEAHGADAATRRRARGWTVIKALACMLIGDAGDHGRPGGKPTWGPPARASLERLTATPAR
jgi:hypothetical protein